MTRRCSHCNQNGHNSRTCPNRGVKLFGVRLTEGSIRKSASMGNLSHHSGSGLSGLVSNNPGSPGNGPDHDGYASEDFVPGSSSRKKGTRFQTLWDFYKSADLMMIVMGCCFRESMEGRGA